MRAIGIATAARPRESRGYPRPVGRTYDGIDEHQRDWIARRPLFFVGTAPLAGDGHVNVSPKGPIGTLRVLDDHTVAYLDVVGSGAETIAHLRENGRIVVMLCAFDGPPRIVRLHGRGEAVLAGDPRFDGAARALRVRRARGRRGAPRRRGGGRDARRRLVRLRRAADALRGRSARTRRVGGEALRVHGPDAFADYQREKNAESLDGLPAVELS